MLGVQCRRLTILIIKYIVVLGLDRPFATLNRIKIGMDHMARITFDIPDDKIRLLLVMASKVGCIPRLKVVGIQNQECSVIFGRDDYQVKQRYVRGYIKNFVGLTIKRLLFTALAVLDRAIDAKRTGRLIVGVDKCPQKNNLHRYEER
jgi:hypothetical protein